MRTSLSEILGIGNGLSNPLVLVEAIRKGLPVVAIIALANCLGLPVSGLDRILPVSHRTLQRYEKEQRALPQDLSDHVVQIANIFIRAEEVLGSSENARLWLGSPCITLGGNKPLEFLDTFSGMRMVEDELGRIEWGVYS